MIIRAIDGSFVIAIAVIICVVFLRLACRQRIRGVREVFTRIVLTPRVRATPAKSRRAM